MNARHLEHFEARLRAERERIRAALSRISAAAAVTAGGDVEPGDDADAGASGVSPSDDAAIAERELAALGEIESALHLIDTSPHDYGICVQCGRPIPDERLEVLPATRYCGRTG